MPVVEPVQLRWDVNCPSCQRPSEVVRTYPQEWIQRRLLLHVLGEDVAPEPAMCPFCLEPAELSNPEAVR